MATSKYSNCSSSCRSQPFTDWNPNPYMVSELVIISTVPTHQSNWMTTDSSHSSVSEENIQSSISDPPSAWLLFQPVPLRWYRCCSLYLPHPLWRSGLDSHTPQAVHTDTTPHTSWLADQSVRIVCVLSPFLYTMFTYDSVTSHKDHVILKLVDDAAVLGLIPAGDMVPNSTRKRQSSW